MKDYSQRAFVKILSHSAGQGVDCSSDDIALILGHKCFSCYKLCFCIHVLSTSLFQPCTLAFFLLLCKIAVFVVRCELEF